MATYPYHYDPLDRLIQTAGIQRFYNQSRMTTEIKGTQRYSVFQQDGRLLAQQRRDRTKDECHLLGTDLQQSVLHAVGADKHHSMAYNAYGHRPVENGLISLLGFNGERADPVTGHYLLGNGYRAFNPVLMRFNSPDSMSPFGKGGGNSYAYCKGNPVLHIDPTGHFLIALVTATARRLGRNLGRFLDRHVDGYLRVAPRIIQGVGASLIGAGLTMSGRQASIALSFGTAFVSIGGALEHSIARLASGLDEVRLAIAARQRAANIISEQGVAFLQTRVAELEGVLASSHRVARENYDDLTRAYETIDEQRMQITQLQAREARVPGAPPPYTATRYPLEPPPPYTPGIPGIATRIRR